MLFRSLIIKRRVIDIERVFVEDRKCMGSLFLFFLFWIFSIIVGIIIFDVNVLFIIFFFDKYLKND